MKQLEGAKRAEMLQDAANKGFDDVTVEILKSKTIFTQNLLLKGDTVEFEDFDIQLIKQGKEFKTVNKDGEEITVRGLMILCCINGVWRWFPLSTFQRGCQIAPEGRTEYMEAIREKHDLNLRIITCGDGLGLHHASLMHDIVRSVEIFYNLLRRLFSRTFAAQICDNA